MYCGFKSEDDNILLKPIIAPDIREFDSLLKESQKWAKGPEPFFLFL